MYDFLLMNNIKYGPILLRFGDTAMYMSKIIEFAYPVGFNAPPGVANDMAVILVRRCMSYVYPISMPSFVPVHWLVFFCTHVDAEEQDDDETTHAIPTVLSDILSACTHPLLPCDCM